MLCCIHPFFTQVVRMWRRGEVLQWHSQVTRALLCTATLFSLSSLPPLQTSGQRESFFQSRDENESFSDSISFIETRPRIPDTYSQASRRDREKISSNLGHRDEIEIYYLHSQTSRREREFPWSDLVFRDETENSETCHLSLKSGLNGLTILHAIFGRLTILNAGPHILLDALDLLELLGFLAFLALLSFRV